MGTAIMATLEELTARVREAVGAGVDLGASVKLNLKGAGLIHVDGANVSNDDLPADLTVTISPADLVALARRELDPMRAVMSGRLKASDMGLVMKLQPRIQALFAQLK